MLARLPTQLRGRLLSRAGQGRPRCCSRPCLQSNSERIVDHYSWSLGTGTGSPTTHEDFT